MRVTASGGAEVTADLYPPVDPGRVVILLFHMAGASRREYRDIAPRLVGLGYLTLAVDRRSGGRFGGGANRTAPGSLPIPAMPRRSPI